MVFPIFRVYEHVLGRGELVLNLKQILEMSQTKYITERCRRAQFTFRRIFPQSQKTKKKPLTNQIKMLKREYHLQSLNGAHTYRRKIRKPNCIQNKCHFPLEN